MGLLDTVKNAVAELAGANRNLDAEIDKLRARQAEIKTLPMPRDDYIAALCEGVDARAARWAETFLHRCEHDMTRYDAAPHMVVLESNGTWNGKDVMPDPLYGIFSDEIKAAITKSVRAMKWPAKVGPARAERSREMAAIEQRIKEIETQRRELRESAREAGIDIAVLTADEEKRLFAGGRPSDPVAIDKARQRA